MRRVPNTLCLHHQENRCHPNGKTTLLPFRSRTTLVLESVTHPSRSVGPTSPIESGGVCAASNSLLLASTPQRKTPGCSRQNFVWRFFDFSLFQLPLPWLVFQHHHHDHLRQMCGSMKWHGSHGMKWLVSCKPHNFTLSEVLTKYVPFLLAGRFGEKSWAKACGTSSYTQDVTTTSGVLCRIFMDFTGLKASPLLCSKWAKSFATGHPKVAGGQQYAPFPSHFPSFRTKWLKSTEEASKGPSSRFKCLAQRKGGCVGVRRVKLLLKPHEFSSHESLLGNWIKTWGSLAKTLKKDLVEAFELLIIVKPSLGLPKSLLSPCRKRYKDFSKANFFNVNLESYAGVQQSHFWWQILGAESFQQMDEFWLKKLV